jgi:hypothetical protein
MEACMQSFMRLLVTALAAVGMVMGVVNAAHAEGLNPRIVAWSKAAPVYAVGELPLPGASFESVLSDPRGAMAGTKAGTGWLLHYGTERDNCARADATSGLRMMCVGW